MGVKGLATFIKENRQSLCRSVHLTAGQAEGQERIPVVVDSWGSAALFGANKRHGLMI